MQKIAYLAAALVLAAFPAHAAQRLITPDDIFNIREVSAPDLSPDGNWVAYQVSESDRKNDESVSHIWMTRFDGQRSIQLTSRPKEEEKTPRFSPDGHWLAFISGRADDKDVDALWLMDRSGGEARKLTDLKGDVIDFAWSPDSKRIVLVVTDPDPDDADDEKKGDDEKKAKPIVIDRFRFLEDYTGYLRNRHDHLYLLDLASKKAEVLTPGAYSEGLPSWSPDGQSIAFVGKRQKDGDRTDNFGLYVVAARKGAQAKQIADRYGADTDAERPGGSNYPAWSPDGKTIAYPRLGDPKLIEYARNYIVTVPSSGGPVNVLAPNLDRNIGLASWSDDGKWVIFQVEDDRAQYLARIPAAGGKLEKIYGARNVVSDYSSKRERTAILLMTTNAPAEIYAWDGKSPPRQISHQNEWLKQVRLAQISEISVKSKDGTEVRGFLIKPPGAGAGRMPTVLHIHGGPQSQFDNEFDIEWQILAGHGYAVIAMNPRGSTGRGQAYCAAIFANWGGPDVPDVLAGIDWAVKAGIADPNRLGVAGWSYGGMLTNYVIASDTRFKGATSGAGISNILAGYGTDQYMYDYETELGTPWKNTATWLKVSYPFLHADRIKTPTLFLGGELDLNVPLRNGMQMYQALKSLGVDTQLVIYPGEYHGISRPSFDKDRMTRYVAWFDKYVRGGR